MSTQRLKQPLPLATLSEDDRAALSYAIQMRAHGKKLFETASNNYNAVWQRIKSQHSLPDVVTFKSDTGEIYEQEMNDG